jgi:hypothetical protein
LCQSEWRALSYPRLPLHLPYPHIREEVPWTDMVTQLYAQVTPADDKDDKGLSNVDVPYIVELIKTEAKNHQSSCPPTELNSIFRKFDPRLGTLRFSGTVHCEAALASLIAYITKCPPESPDATEELENLMKVRSRLYCVIFLSADAQYRVQTHESSVCQNYAVPFAGRSFKF